MRIQPSVEESRLLACTSFWDTGYECSRTHLYPTTTLSFGVWSVGVTFSFLRGRASQCCSNRVKPRNRSPLGPAWWRRHLPSYVRHLCLGWGVIYSPFSGTKYSDDLVVRSTVRSPGPNTCPHKLFFPHTSLFPFFFFLFWTGIFIPQSCSCDQEASQVCPTRSDNNPAPLCSLVLV